MCLAYVFSSTDVFTCDNKKTSVLQCYREEIKRTKNQHKNAQLSTIVDLNLNGKSHRDSDEKLRREN